ncbi:S26 family signal peptidase [Streptomyces sp. NBC_01433]|uniref:S26 family signal peptidase n=1 Tax=Streptomyces sp. NBC_01433 TaxID=2903864 RepID=UPI00224D5D68|nr:S26 family signal peptidase [Streptomyces sp. NBC_01433]MCX4680164.1 S26 family signal peptidase [Streptomyces sp. NBC_01433]
MIVRLARRLLRTRLLAVTVTGPSMEPALRDGDRVLVRRRTSGPARGDVVVLEPPPGAREAGLTHEGLIIKRVAAGPGDPVPALFAERLGVPPGAVVPPGHYLVLGDNRPLSIDSRRFGYVTRALLTGVVTRPLPRHTPTVPAAPVTTADPLLPVAEPVRDAG